MTRKKALGKGLEALLHSKTDASDLSADNDTYQTIDVLDIVPNPNQPRMHFSQDSINELASSIVEQGLLQPIVVRATEDGKFELIVGERRWLAAKQARLNKIPALVRLATDRESMVLALIENVQREDLNTYEEATALHELASKHKLTHRQIAKIIGKSRTAVSNLIRLLQLHQTVLKQLADGSLEEGHARTLLGLEKPRQAVLGAKIAQGRLSVRQAEDLVKRIKEGEERQAGVDDEDRDVTRLENELSELLGVTVRIQSSKKAENGKMTISYRKLEELDEVIKRLKHG